jgi:metallophosphoesterase (TIGR00282 family)
MADVLRFLCIGDIIGYPGVLMFQKWVPQLKAKYQIDAVIVNGENAAKNGKGLIPKHVDFFKHCGADVITTGNHVWEHRELYATLDERDDIIRPANYPPGCQGKGHAFLTVRGHTVAVTNLMGRGFVRDVLDCPFRTIDSLLTFLSSRTNIILVDFHAEATAEKRVMGTFLDGRVSALWGTHTHVQTADEGILPKGTGYITDVGSCCALNSVIGFQQDQILNRFLYHAHMGKFVVETEGPMVLSGIWVEIDTETGMTKQIERVRVIDDNLQVSAAQEANIGK